MRLIRFVGVMFIVGGVLTLLVAGLVSFVFSTIPAFGTHQGSSPRPLPLLFYLEVGKAGMVSAVLISVGVGLIRLKPWARVGAIVAGAVSVYFSIACLIALYAESPMVEPPIWMFLVATIFPPAAVIVGLLALLMIIGLLTPKGRAAFFQTH